MIKKILACTVATALAITALPQPSTMYAAKQSSQLVVSQEKVTLVAGKSKNITANMNVTWKSSNAKIAKVSSISKKKAKITAVKEGKCTITVKSKNKTKKIKVTVTPKITVSQKSLTLVEGKSKTVTTNKNSTWKSSDAQIAKVSPISKKKAKITAKKEGTCTITVKSGSETIRVKVTVTKAVEPSKEPEPAMTAEPSKEPEPTMTAEPSKEPEPTMTAQPSKEPEVATMAAIISKVEDGSIWIENGAKKLGLSENAKILKDTSRGDKEESEITVYELFEGDEITITYSTAGAEGYTSDLLGCEKIVVENSKIYLLKEDKISQIQNGGGMFLRDFFAPLWYQDGNHPESTGSDRATKIIKNGKEISFDELQEGDILRVSFRQLGGEEGKPGFTDFLETVIVLSE